MGGLALWLANANFAFATTYSWTSQSGTQWSTAANWDVGTPVSSPDTHLVFYNNSPRTTSNDLISPFTVNSLSFLLGGVGDTTVVGNKIVFEGDSPLLSVLPEGNTKISVYAAIQSNQMLTVVGGGSIAKPLYIQRLDTGTHGLTVQEGVVQASVTGPVTVQAGRLDILNSVRYYIDDAGGTVGGDYAIPTVNVKAGGTVMISDNSFASFTVAGTGALGLGGAALIANDNLLGPVTLAADASISAFATSEVNFLRIHNLDLGSHALTLNPQGQLVTLSRLTGTGTLNLAMSSGGEVKVGEGISTFSGTVVVVGGRVSGDLGKTFDNSSSMSLGGGAVLDVQNSSPLPASLAMSLSNGGGTVLGGSQLKSFEISSPIGGTGSLGIGTPESVSNISLSGENTFSGGIRIERGSALAISNNAALGATGNVITLADSSTGFSSFKVYDGVTITADRQIVSGQNSYLDIGNDVEIAARISGGDTRFYSNGAYSITGINDFVGNLTFAGTMTISSASALGASQNIVYFSQNSRFRVGGNLSLSQTMWVSRYQAGAAIDTNGFNINLTGTFRSDDAVSVITKVGNGTLLINGISSKGAGGFASTLEVKNGTVGGEGDLGGGALTLDPGTRLAPGAADGVIGTLQAASLYWSGGAVLEFNLGLGEADRLIVDSLVGDDGRIHLFAFSGEVEPGDYLLITNSNGAAPMSTFELSDFTFSGIEGFNGTFSMSAQGLVLTVSPVSEPGTWLLMLVAGMVLGGGYVRLKASESPVIRDCHRGDRGLFTSLPW